MSAAALLKRIKSATAATKKLLEHDVDANASAVPEQTTQSPSKTAAKPLWVAIEDKLSKTKYYENTLTGAVSWELNEEIGKVIYPMFPWEEHFDEDSQASYYENVMDHRTTWLHPIEFETLRKLNPESFPWVRKFDDEGIQYFENVETSEVASAYPGMPVEPEYVAEYVRIGEWTQYFTDEGQAYWESDDGLTTWHHPTILVSKSDPMYPWVTLIDPETCKTYYESLLDLSISFENPLAAKVLEAPVESVEPVEIAPKEPELPEQWKERRNDFGGVYWEHEDGTTSYHHPSKLLKPSDPMYPYLTLVDEHGDTYYESMLDGAVLLKHPYPKKVTAGLVPAQPMTRAQNAAKAREEAAAAEAALPRRPPAPAAKKADTKPANEIPAKKVSKQVLQQKLSIASTTILKPAPSEPTSQSKCSMQFVDESSQLASTPEAESTLQAESALQAESVQEHTEIPASMPEASESIISATPTPKSRIPNMFLHHTVAEAEATPQSITQTIPQQIPVSDAPSSTEQLSACDDPSSGNTPVPDAPTLQTPVPNSNRDIEDPIFEPKNGYLDNYVGEAATKMFCQACLPMSAFSEPSPTPLTDEIKLVCQTSMMGIMSVALPAGWSGIEFILWPVDESSERTHFNMQHRLTVVGFRCVASAVPLQASMSMKPMRFNASHIPHALMLLCQSGEEFILGTDSPIALQQWASALVRLLTALNDVAQARIKYPPPVSAGVRKMFQQMPVAIAIEPPPKDPTPPPSPPRTPSPPPGPIRSMRPSFSRERGAQAPEADRITAMLHAHKFVSQGAPSPHRIPKSAISEAAAALLSRTPVNP